VCRSLSQYFSDFWKLGTGYIEGKYVKSKEITKTNRRQIDIKKIEHCHRMASELAHYFSNVIQHILSLPFIESTVEPTSPVSPTSPGLANFPPLPKLTSLNAITVGVFSPRIIGALQKCASAVRDLKVGPEPCETMDTILERSKEKLSGMLISSWVSGTHNLTLVMLKIIERELMSNLFIIAKQRICFALFLLNFL
jgi:hypothetical protein